MQPGQDNYDTASGTKKKDDHNMTREKELGTGYGSRVGQLG